MDEELRQALNAIRAGAPVDRVLALMPSDEYRRQLREALAQEQGDDGFSLGDAARMAAQGATFGFGDELAGLGAAIVPGGKGYSEARDASRQRLERLRREHPVASLAAEAVGGLLVPGFGAFRAGATAVRGAAGATRAARAVQAARAAARTGAVEGAIYGFGEAEGSPGEQVAETALGAALGAAGGAALGGATGALRRRGADAAADVVEQATQNQTTRRRGVRIEPEPQPEPQPRPTLADGIAPPAEGASDLLTELEQTGLRDITPEGMRMQRNLDIARGQAEWDRTPVSHREQIQRARKILENVGLDGNAMPERPRGPGGRRLEPADVLATAENLRKNFDDFLTISKRLETGADDAGNPLAPGAVEELGRQLDNLTSAINSDASTLGQAGTEAGRQLNIFRLLARRGEPKDNKAAWLYHAQKVKGSLLTQDEVAFFTRLIDANDEEELLYQISKMARDNRREKAGTFFRAELLLNPVTHISNVLGNATSLTFRDTRDWIAYGVDLLASKATGVQTKMRPSERYGAQARALRDAAKQSADILGLTGQSRSKFMQGEGARATLRAWSEAVRRGDIRAEDLDKFDIKQVHFENPVVDTLVKVTFSALGAGDRIFRAPAFVGSLADQAKTIASLEGRTGRAARERIAELMQHPTEEMVLEARAAAERAVFMERGALAKASAELRQWFNRRGEDLGRFVAPAFNQTVGRAVPRLSGVLDDGIPLGDVILPFTTFASNIATWSVRSPYRGAKGVVRLVQAANRQLPAEARVELQREGVEGVAEGLLSTGAIYLGYKLAEAGLLTGPGMTQEKMAYYNTVGGGPNSLKIGDRWIRIDRFAPVTNLLMAGAAMYEARTTEDLDGLHKAIGIIGTAATAPLDLPLMQGTREFLNAVSGLMQMDPRGFGRWASGVAGSVVTPPLVSRAASALDDRERQADSFTERIQARTPFVRNLLPERIDVLGESIPRDGGFSAVFNPAPISQDRTRGDVVRSELQRLRLGIGQPKRQEGESREAYQRRSEIAGARVRAALENLLFTNDYLNATDDERTEMIRREISRIRGQVTRELREGR